jgi:hypothetical protein
MSASSFAASRPAASRWSVMIPQCRHPIDREGRHFLLSPAAAAGAWTNEVTVRSGRLARMYEPGVWIARICHITLTDLELRAYEQALEPKRLVTIEGGHFDHWISSRWRALRQCPGSTSI